MLIELKPRINPTSEMDGRVEVVADNLLKFNTTGYGSFEQALAAEVRNQYGPGARVLSMRTALIVQVSFKEEGGNG